jgi:hypothetical protein
MNVQRAVKGLLAAVRVARYLGPYCTGRRSFSASAFPRPVLLLCGLRDRPAVAARVRGRASACCAPVAPKCWVLCVVASSAAVPPLRRRGRCAMPCAPSGATCCQSPRGAARLRLPRGRDAPALNCHGHSRLLEAAR